MIFTIKGVFTIKCAFKYHSASLVECALSKHIPQRTTYVYARLFVDWNAFRMLDAYVKSLWLLFP
jgi:hypothetical protein